MISVAIFEDNASRREGLKMLLDAMEDMVCVAHYADCRKVEEFIKNKHADVVLMDINMPYVNGIEGLKIIKKHKPNVKVIMSTIFEDESKILEAICSGADGYILKQKSPLKLLDGIREVMNGGAPMTPIVARKVLTLMATPAIKPIDEDFGITRREKEILKYLVEGYSYKMIADKCFVSYATVNKHVSNIYSKLQVHSVAAAVSMALKKGLV
ncbi:MAG: response regulator transcription factor [Saprospiraceae bacterium]|nr:response regulator transcription factor [Bacteroidia bacterium]NNE15023.1 response regulator transcription factor [Saprospiraceae bacterium]NNL91331.1 response regulator transcription factor [Saprospiraceae bacterium]